MGWEELPSPFLVLSQKGRNKKRRRRKRRRPIVIVSTISFLQENLQHCIAASGIITRTVSVKGMDMALIQELWYREESIRGLNIPGYTQYAAGGRERPRACILARNMSIWTLPGFSCRDLVAVLEKYFEDGADRRLVGCSAYLP